MRQTSASNLALLLAVLAWPLTYYGIMSQLGDYRPGTPLEVILANQRMSVAVLSVGFLSLMASLWLSGYSFTGARMRSISAALISTGLITFGIIGLWL